MIMNKDQERTQSKKLSKLYLIPYEYSCPSSMFYKCLFTINFVNVFLCINLLFPILSSSLLGMDSSKFIWAPHFISIEFIGTSELISILLGICAFVQGVASLEAQIFIPTMLGLEMVSQELECNISMFC